MILLIDNYDSFTYNIYQYVEILGHHCQVVRNDALSVEEVRALNPDKIIISPGPGNPDSAGISLKVIKELGHKTPILGVCLGHQAIGQAFGGRVIRSPRAKHGKVSKIRHDQKGIFAGVENPFTAARYHSLIVERETLPSCLQLTAQTDDGLIMGLRHRVFPMEGVQFHPESVATKEGMKLIENFLGGKKS